MMPRKHRRAMAGLCLAAGLGLFDGAAALAQEAPADVLAAAVRTHGFPCDRALGAERAGAAAADRAVWILRCGNASYRVTLSANHAPQVEKLN
jgi:hypothetical protein